MNERLIDEILKNIDAVVRPNEFRHSFGSDGQTENGAEVAMGLDLGANVGKVVFKPVERERSAKEIVAILRARAKINSHSEC